jgi:hypothetical protein
MNKSFQVLFCIKLEKLYIPIGVEMSCSGFVTFVLATPIKLISTGEFFKANAERYLTQ